ncbi:hypothetical protein JN531_016940 (plasmid) [Flagellatimonas centrodinii]|uniref:hypothetical protein n=1 Tax=Flagellatimonas centrodinii TaxID=2806210 RepID=UPI001FFBB0A5|nr:hypothetical protein [Flagellatimonas centrodinii]ULQ48319.1 hypothetical protein JN531_016940 [Flagellatimonas centrodinii]
MTTTTKDPQANPSEAAAKRIKIAGAKGKGVISSKNMKPVYDTFWEAGKRARELEAEATRPGSGIRVVRLVR